MSKTLVTLFYDLFNLIRNAGKTTMMNKSHVFRIAKEETPHLEINHLDGWFRHDVINELKGNSNIGIELGVAKGVFSKRMVDSGKFKRFYGIDSYSAPLGDRTYKNTMNYIGIERVEYSLIRMDFENALDLFEDEYFDFIYIDGFAHTGEEGGKTLIDWYRKLKPGGILAGDDYHEDWPLVVWAVNDFAEQTRAKLNVTGATEQLDFCRYPTWFMRKSHERFDLKINERLYQISMKEKKRIHDIRSGGNYVKFRKLIGAFLDFIGLKEFTIKVLDRLR